MRYYGGIDPGLTGALSVLDFKKFLLHVWDTPTVTVQSGDRKKQRCNPVAYADALHHFPLDECLIENVHSTPNDGHVGAFQFGKVTGIAIGAMAGLQISMLEVAPAKWKMNMAVPADKSAAVLRASELFPNCTAAWSRKMDHGRAESALIALYGAIKAGLVPSQPFQLGLVNGTPYSGKK